MSNPNEAESFFKEVDEGVRQDRYMAMAKRWGPWAGGAFVLMLVGVFAAQLWEDHEKQASQAQASAFAQAQEQAQSGDVAAATARFEQLSREGPEVYRVMAMMEHAAGLQQQGDLQGAIAGFDAAAQATHDPILRDSARLRAAYIVADTQDFQAVRTRLQPLIDGGGQMSYLAKELFAVEAWEAGQNELARSTLADLQYAFAAPESVRRRAQLEMAVLPPAPPGAAPAAPAPAPGARPQNGETK